MEVNQSQIFNLWDTNGRRRDILNALKLYLEILEEIRREYPGIAWSSYPNSVAEFVFYQKAVQYSPEVFQVHPKYDDFLARVGDDLEAFLRQEPERMAHGLSPEDRKCLDRDMEARARHYTSNLVRIGFADGERNLSDVGAAFLAGRVNRDSLEELLPVDDINLLVLRQLFKLKIFTNPAADGSRGYYCPFCMALLLLLENDAISKDTLLTIVQGLNPYLDEQRRDFALANIPRPENIETMVWDMEFPVPEDFETDGAVPFERFTRHIKNQKSRNTVAIYYEFYQCLLAFRENTVQETYDKLMDCVEQNREKLQKAFGCGRPLFRAGRGKRPELDKFLEDNRDTLLLGSSRWNRAFYLAYRRSGRADDIREYSDTTERLLGATGLFRFDPLPDLAFKELLAHVFDREYLRANVFGVMSNAEYLAFEEAQNCVFRQNKSLVELQHYDRYTVTEIFAQISRAVGETDSIGIRAKMRSRTSDEFARHIAQKYPKEKVLRLLPLFSDRNNDNEIRKAVNDTASVPTIYEYIVAIAWYYLSDKDFNLYESLNLTMNADYEPVVHAGGGDGDIVIHYDDLVVMLEVTLMNKQAQKRGEWEPVLRHSLNLKAANEDKETVTYFIADELDYNTINIWRAVAAAPLESTNTHTLVDGVMIMPFTNAEVAAMLGAGVSSGAVLDAVRASFAEVPKITNLGWKDRIMDRLSQKK